MKYGQTLRQRSVPQWAYNNLDYNELKHLIKVHTTRGQGQAIAVPGHDDVALEKFEAAFFHELYAQHERIDDFVRDKANEIGRRLQDYHDKAGRYLSKIGDRDPAKLTIKQRQRLSTLENMILRCEEDAHNLQRYVEAQTLGFRKLLKKYKKWTGSPNLGARFSAEVLSNPKSFTRRDFSRLINLSEETLAALRAASPAASPAASRPSSPELERNRRRPPPQQSQPQQHYWNEYDDGSDNERDDEPYAIYIEQPASEEPPSKLATALSTLTSPFSKMVDWFKPKTPERNPLAAQEAGAAGRAINYGTIRSDMESDNDDASSSDFPNGYTAHYASFPSVSDQRHARHREALLFIASVGCFAAATILLAVAAVLIMTGKHKLRAEVDAGAMVGVVASLCFATCGLGAMLNRQDRLGWVHRILVCTAFIAACVACGVLLVFIAANS